MHLDALLGAGGSATSAATRHEPEWAGASGVAFLTEFRRAREAGFEIGNVAVGHRQPATPLAHGAPRAEGVLSDAVGAPFTARPMASG